MIAFCKVPELIHVEVTSKCNMQCSQCYNSNSEKDIKSSILLQTVKEAGSLGVKYIALSGGEPLLYPEIFSTLKTIRYYGITSLMATNGMGLNVDIINQLRDSGLGCLFLSLNGSIKKIHKTSRGNYDETIKALMLLKKSNLWYEINWVARNDNVEDFSNLVRMCTHYKAKAVNVVMLKPDIHNKLDNGLNRDQLFALANQIKNLRNLGFNINVEFCFSQLRYLLSWNNESNMAECQAGISLMAINVEGEKLPCRHLQHPTSNMKSLMNYWKYSDVLKRLRNIDESIKEPCSSCFRSSKCRACRAVADKVYGSLESGILDCPLHNATCG
jgi:radical SAM protein with 4Fe4S-binding SPASM domain